MSAQADGSIERYFNQCYLGRDTDSGRNYDDTDPGTDEEGGSAEFVEPKTLEIWAIIIAGFLALASIVIQVVDFLVDS